MKTADEIIDKYCKETSFNIGASRSALRRFVEWQIKQDTELEQAAREVDWDAVATVLDEIVVDEGDESLIADIRSFAALLQGKPS